MDYLSSFDISGSGMRLEKARLDVTALNLANAHTTKTQTGGVYKPLKLTSAPAFGVVFDNAQRNMSLVQGTEITQVTELDTPPRLVHEPGHPDADEKGYVAYPDIDPLSEMINLITATRAYEANIRAMNAAKTMALKALDMGR